MLSGDEAQQLIEEVANMLRSSTSSGNGPAAAEAATRAASLASDLTSSLQSTQGRPSLALATTANPTADSTELSLCSLTKLPHAKTEPVGKPLGHLQFSSLPFSMDATSAHLPASAPAT